MNPRALVQYRNVNVYSTLQTRFLEPDLIPAPWFFFFPFISHSKARFFQAQLTKRAGPFFSLPSAQLISFLRRVPPAHTIFYFLRRIPPAHAIFSATSRPRVLFSPPHPVRVHYFLRRVPPACTIFSFSRTIFSSSCPVSEYYFPSSFHDR